MKQHFTFIACFLCLLFNVAKATETEPNNTKAQANTLALNGTNNGKAALNGDMDWWKVTTTSDGKLNINLTALSGRPTWVYLYDNNGTIQLNAQYTSSSMTLSTDGLAAGTYFIKVNCYYTTDSSSYIISNTLTVPAQANDVEPNAIKAQAITLPLNGNKTGHIGYYYNNLRDTFDWYRVTINGDGRLRLRITSYNGQNVWAYLYDNNGTTQLNAAYTSSTTDINTDGLAPGTYYIRVNNYYTNTEFARYKLEDSLFKPAQASDIEPDNNRASALTLTFNGSTTGHIGYYYNNLRDTFDWYKVTTNGDGRLRLRITSYNGQNVWAYLYDNNGTTQLNAAYTSSTTDINTDGLAAGTYYIRVNNYYTNTEFAPYKLEDSLFKPAQAGDSEFNGSKAQAVTFAPNSTKTGHINYYYNGRRDSADWYKLTIPQDGMINIAITSNNGQNVWAYLFDNNGTTQLNAQYTSSSTNFNTDGLRAGTYYIRVNTYYTSEFAPYTLKNTLITYTNSNDAEPNGYFNQARTVPANGKATGHVNFYYNGSRDAEDRWKINYTGTGNLTLVFNQENRLLNGTTAPTFFQVYKDTTAAPIFSNYFNATSGNISFTGLAQGYYYIRVVTYYSTDYSSYSFTNTFTQVNIAKVRITGSVIAHDCSSTNSLTIQCSGSHSPYSVQLYRYGVAYGSPKIDPNTAPFTITNLPPGVYKLRAYGDGATGKAYDSAAITFVPVPTTLTVTNIQSTQAKLNWNASSCVKYYQVQYRKLGTTSWVTGKTNGNTSFLTITGLTLNTKYEWHVAPADSANRTLGMAPYSVLDTFATTTANMSEMLAADMATDKGENITVTAYPNPAATRFVIQLNGSKLNGLATLWLRDMNGTVVWSKQQVQLDAIKGMQVDVSKLAAGIYSLQVVTGNNKLIAVKKVIISR